MNALWLNVLRDTVTVALFALFVALVLDTWRPRRRKDLDAAAALVFDAEDERGAGSAGERTR